MKVHKLITLGTNFKDLWWSGRGITIFSKFIANYIEQGWWHSSFSLECMHCSCSRTQKVHLWTCSAKGIAIGNTLLHDWNLWFSYVITHVECILKYCYACSRSQCIPQICTHDWCTTQVEIIPFVQRFPYAVHQGCQHWMRVWSEKCEGPSTASLYSRATDTFFNFDLKIFASILQAHNRGTLRTSQTSDKQKKKKIAWEILISLWERENVVKCVRVGSPAVHYYMGT